MYKDSQQIWSRLFFNGFFYYLAAYFSKICYVHSKICSLANNVLRTHISVPSWACFPDLFSRHRVGFVFHRVRLLPPLLALVHHETGWTHAMHLHIPVWSKQIRYNHVSVQYYFVIPKDASSSSDTIDRIWHQLFWTVSFCMSKKNTMIFLSFS